MGCDKPENLPDPTSNHDVDDLSLSIRQSGAAVIQGGFSSGANVTSSPSVSMPAVHPPPGNVNEMNNLEMVDLMNRITHHGHLEPNLTNVRNTSPSFSSPSELPHCLENGAELNHSHMNKNTPTSDSLVNEGVLSEGIQNPGASMNFMPMQSSGAGWFETAEKVTGISQNSFQASGIPFGIGYNNMQNTKSIGGIGIHNDAMVNPVPSPSPGNFDGSFLTLGIGSNIEQRSNLGFSGKEVSSRPEEAVLPQSNNSPIQQMRRNFPSLIDGVPGGITNFQRDRGGMPNSARNSDVLAPGLRISAPPFMPNSAKNLDVLAPGLRISAPPFMPSSAWNSDVLAPGLRISAPLFMYETPDARLNSSNTRNLGAVGKADLRLSEPDPLKYAQGGLPPPPLSFSSNSTLPPHLEFGRMAAAPESAHPIRVVSQSTINQQSNLHTNISRNQPFMGSPILSHGSGRMRQDHLGQQSFINVPHPWGDNLYPEGMRAQIAGWSGIQPAPENQFPKRLGVQLNDGAIPQATREGVPPATGGIQQIRRGNLYQSQDHGPKMRPTESFHPPFAMGRPQGGSPANCNVSGLPYYAGMPYNVSGLPFHAGQGVPTSKVDVTPPQASYIHGHPSLKRRASRPPPTAPAYQRRRTLPQHSNQQLIGHQRQITNSAVPASSPSLPSPRVKRQGLEEAVGEKCLLCKRYLVFNPEGSFSRPAIPPAVAVLPCGHVFHDQCLQNITPQDQSTDPPCIPCALGET